ncbi:MAG TPA: LOG family protein [Casimicrobiaceae bacterium]|nr:LOG family protein [Casimicrobiaceae bacterium]
MPVSHRRVSSSRRGIPIPARHERRSPLPWNVPKSEEDDHGAPERVRRLLESPSYRQADEDLALLQQPQMRGVRLQLDYWKAENLLQAHGIGHTIVVFGSTRITEPPEARRRLRAVRAALKDFPQDAERQRAVRVAEQIVAKSRYYDVAREFGRIVGQAGRGADPHQLVIMTGAGPGIMEAANRGAFEVGAETVGLNVKLPQPQFPNPYLTPELCFRFHYFAIRKLHFLERARALVVFPGGYGTMDEMFETLALVQTRTIAPVPVVLVGKAYWRRAIDFDFLVAEGVIEAEDIDLFWYAETAEEIWSSIIEWYACQGRSLRAGSRGAPEAP